MELQLQLQALPQFSGVLFSGCFTPLRMPQADFLAHIRNSKSQRCKPLIFSISGVVSRAYLGSDSGNSPDTDMDGGDDDNGEVSKQEWFDESDSGDDAIRIEIRKMGRNRRLIQATIGIEAGLERVWSILTDYERLPEFIPGLAVSKLVEKGEKFARVFQIGEQDLPLGLRFNAKGTMDCFEGEVEMLSNGRRREMEFMMVEGDFQVYEGKWCVEEVVMPDSVMRRTMLSYMVDVKPKLWLPVQLVENRLCNEIRRNLSCFRHESQKSSVHPDSTLQ